METLRSMSSFTLLLALIPWNTFDTGGVCRTRLHRDFHAMPSRASAGRNTPTAVRSEREPISTAPRCAPNRRGR